MRLYILLGVLLVLFCSSVYGISTDHLYSYYSFDDSNGKDSLDNYHVTDNGGAGSQVYVTGLLSNGLNVSSVGNSMINSTANNHEIDVLIHGNFTVNLWVSETGAVSNGGFVSWGSTDFNALSMTSIAPTTLQYIGDTTGSTPWDILRSGTFITGSRNSGVWTMITMVSNVTHFMASINGTGSQFNDTYSKPFIMTDNQFKIGSNYAGSTSMNGVIDEISVWNVSLSQSEILELYNSGIGFNPLTGTDSSSIDILTANETGSYLDIFDEHKRFYMYINWTNDADDTALNQSVGACNMSAEGVYVDDIHSMPTTKTICNSGCDNDTYFASFNIDPDGIVVKDLIELEVCHNNLVSRDLSVGIQCGVNSTTETILASSFETCLTGHTELFINTSICIGYNNINITLDNTAPNLNHAHELEEFHFYREFANRTLNVHFNVTSQLWQSDETHLYFEHGAKNLYGNCTHSTSAFDNSIDESITIVNRFPEIIFEQVSINNNTINITDGMVVDYFSDNWQWFIAVIDDDIVEVNYSFYNSTGDRIFFENVGLPKIISTPNNTFVDFAGNPFNLTVVASDSNTNVTQESILFNISDTTDPVCVGFADDSIDFNTTFNWNINCSDENFFSFNLSCVGSSNFSFYEDGLNTPSYSFINSTNIIENTTCEYVYCDGHTANLLDNMIISDKGSNTKRTFDNKISIESDRLFDNFDTLLKVDRYTFTIQTKQAYNNISFRVNSDEHIYIMSDPKYAGWLITGDYWIDFENDHYKLVETTRISSTEVNVFIQFNRPISYMEFKSIGKLNCISGTMNITSTTPTPTVGGSYFNMDTCPLDQTISYVLGFFFIVVLLLTLVAFNELWFKIPLFNLLAGVSFFFVSLSVYACSLQIATPFVVFGFVLIISEIIRFNHDGSVRSTKTI